MRNDLCFFPTSQFNPKEGHRKWYPCNVPLPPTPKRKRYQPHEQHLLLLLPFTSNFTISRSGVKSKISKLKFYASLNYTEKLIQKLIDNWQNIVVRLSCIQYLSHFLVYIAFICWHSTHLLWALFQRLCFLFHLFFKLKIQSLCPIRNIYHVNCEFYFPCWCKNFVDK